MNRLAFGAEGNGQQKDNSILEEEVEIPFPILNWLGCCVNKGDCGAVIDPEYILNKGIEFSNNLISGVSSTKCQKHTLNACTVTKENNTEIDECNSEIADNAHPEYTEGCIENCKKIA